jgi:ornithine decarboxylase
MTPLQLGRHLILDISCVRDIQSLNTVESACAILDAVVDACGFTVVGRTVHQFEPAGATAIYLLSESHISIHTWPEKAAACVDIFCCDQRMWVDDAMRAFRRVLPGAVLRSHVIPRQG